MPLVEFVAVRRALLSLGSELIFAFAVSQKRLIMPQKAVGKPP
jgi:hypothetical protein